MWVPELVVVGREGVEERYWLEWLGMEHWDSCKSGTWEVMVLMDCMESMEMGCTLRELVQREWVELGWELIEGTLVVVHWRMELERNWDRKIQCIGMQHREWIPQRGVN